MKLFTATSIMLASSSGFARGALPPGHQDRMLCPEGSCSLYIEQPLGFTGPKSAFYKCLDMETDELIDAVWTGSLTDVVPPQGWVEDPEDCDSLYDDEDDDEDEEEPLLNLNRPGGVCFDDSDCYTEIRFLAPPKLTGPEPCSCFGASELIPWDQTEGQEIERWISCMRGACDGYEAYCTLAPDDNGMGECAVRPIESSSTSPAPTEEKDEKSDDEEDDEDEEEPRNLDSPGGLCVDDSDCYTRIRSAGPPNLTGPEPCSCFGASELLPWDQTEGQRDSPGFRWIRCMPGACDGYEAYCTRKPDEPGMGVSFAMGECALRPIESSSTSPAPTEEKDEKSDDEDGNEDDEEPRNLDRPEGFCLSDIDCETRIRGAMPVSSKVGPGFCGCYAGSELNPWDETEGQEHFRRARCMPGACDGYEAYCTLAPDDNGIGECALRQIESTSSTQEEGEDTSNKIVSPTPAPPAPRSASSSEDLPSDDTDSEDNESNQSPPAAVM